MTIKILKWYVYVNYVVRFRNWMIGVYFDWCDYYTPTYIVHFVPIFGVSIRIKKHIGCSTPGCHNKGMITCLRDDIKDFYLRDVLCYKCGSLGKCKSDPKCTHYIIPENKRYV